MGGTGTIGATASSTTGAGVVPADDPVDEGAAGAPGDLEVATNPFVMAEYDPLSTFAADADTASYDTFRAMALSGSIPDASRVRLEEFVNYFHYDYPAADSDADVPFGIMLDAAPSPFGTGTTHLRVGIQG
jgi:Ca-activated chloride channel family protein